MMGAVRGIVLVCLAILPALFAVPANAANAADGLKICNHTSYVLYAATGVQEGASVETRGWLRVVPGDCRMAITHKLSSNALYLYARSSQAHSGPAREWGGNAPLCAKDTDFALKTQIGLGGCGAGDAFQMPFALVDTHGKSSWTATLYDSLGLRTANAALEAGIVRLLNDIGYDIGKDHRDLRAAAAAALKKFRARMKLPQTATDDDLFDALETEALKASAPTGYSICNDAQKAVWAAIGLQNGNDWSSRGWWRIAPGSCAHALTTALTYDHVYLLVERKDKHRIVTGPVNFCITAITFQVTGRAKCKSRGLEEAGFAATTTKGHSGYAVHIGEDGLIPPAPRLH
jgi:uncharacterized membrane protein